MTPNFQAKAEGDALELMIYDAIGPEWMGMVSAKAVTQALNENKNAKRVTVRINSPGGSAFDGIAIHNALRSHTGKITTVAEGIAASAASVIFMAGDTREIHESAMLMIHDASGVTMGTEKDHRQQADALAKLDGAIASVYANATGGDADTIRELMNEDYFMDAEEALKDGYATAMIVGTVPEARFDLSMLGNVPQAIAERFGRRENTTTPPEQPDMTPDQFRAKHGDAVNDWINEGFQDGHATALKEDRDALNALVNAYGGDLAKACQAFIDGVSVQDAKDAHAKTLAEQLAETQAKLEAAEKRAAELDNGADPVQLNAAASVSNDTPTEEDEKRQKVQTAAAKIPNEYARKAYIASAGYDPAGFTFTN